MAFKSNSNLMSGQSSFLLVITVFCLIIAAVMAKLPPAYGGVIVVGIIVFMATFMSTEAGLYLLICSMLLSPEFGSGGLEGGDTTASRGVTIRGEDMLLVLLGFAWLMRTAIHKDLGLIRPTPLNGSIGIYVAVYLFATLAGFIAGHVRGITGFFYVLKYVEYFIVYFIVSNNLETRDQIRRFIITMLITAFIVSITATAQIPGGERVSAPFEGERGEPNTLGGYLLLIGSVVAGLAINLKDKSITRWLWMLLAFMFIPFMFTQSRGSYLALPFVYMTFGFLLPSKRIKMVVLAVVFFIFGVLFMPATVTDRIMYTFEQGYTQQKKVKIGDVELDTSTTERLESWTSALSDGIKSPIWGFGVTGYGFLDAQYPRIWVETGLLGLFFFGSLMYKVFKQGFQLYGNTEDPLFKGLGMGLIAGTVGLLFHALGANTFMIVRVMEPFWLIVGMVVFANKLEADAAAKEIAEEVETTASGVAAIRARGSA
ncbi:MAG: O-antigen ligase family protein [Gemmatimonadetes bacterium]|jgi:hypothetical protein|nr:O-antigen ligase family protein [Gemmatimonadota bacterium]